MTPEDYAYCVARLEQGKEIMARVISWTEQDDHSDQPEMIEHATRVGELLDEAIADLRAKQEVA